jgi:hypothetical protein
MTTTTTTPTTVWNKRFAHLREQLSDPEFQSAIATEEQAARTSYAAEIKERNRTRLTGKQVAALLRQRSAKPERRAVETAAGLIAFAVRDAERRVRAHYVAPARIDLRLGYWIKFLHWIQFCERAKEARPWATLAQPESWRSALPETPRQRSARALLGRIDSMMLERLAALAERTWNELEAPASVTVQHAPTSPPSDDADFKPANYFTKKIARRIRQAALPTRQTMRVRKTTLDRVTVYSLTDCKQHWPGEKLSRE